jgi:hypothetical protein
LLAGNLYPRLQAIDTNYLISDEESILLAQAANHIINTKQTKSWDFCDKDNPNIVSQINNFQLNTVSITQ